MNRKQTLRLTGIISILIIIAIAMSLILYALKQNINLFYTPTQLLKSPMAANQIVRVGGYVKEHSVHFDSSGESVTFAITDTKNTVVVNYHGVLPSLFREKQGIVVTGKLNESGLLLANQVLAKHDEKYMPWPLAKELKPGEKNAT